VAVVPACDSQLWIAYAMLNGPQGSNYERKSNHPLTRVAGLFIDMGSSDARAELGVFLVQVQI
jgi:hypothetical protein